MCFSPGSGQAVSIGDYTGHTQQNVPLLVGHAMLLAYLLMSGNAKAKTNIEGMVVCPCTFVAIEP